MSEQDRSAPNGAIIAPLPTGVPISPGLLLVAVLSTFAALHAAGLLPVRRTPGSGAAGARRPSASLENSRKMKEKSHRATRRCYRSGVDALRGTHERRLDGYRLYSASDLPRRRVCEAGRRPLRPAGRQRRRRLDAGQSPGHPAGPERAVGRLSRRRARTGQSLARDDRAHAAAHLRAVRRLRRLQRRRPAGPRPDPQTHGGPRSSHGASAWPRSRRCRASRTPCARASCAL